MNKKLKIVLIIISSLIILGLAFFYFSHYFYTQYIFYKLSDRYDEIPDFETLEEKPEGEIYLTLSPIGEENPNIYRLNLSSLEIEPVFNNDNNNYMARFSPNKEKMVFVREYDDESGQVVFIDTETEEIKEITSRSQFFPRNPVFSPDGERITYWVYNYDDSYFGPLPHDHSIYVSSLDGEQEMVANGVFPFFLPDGKSLIFLKNDGLRTINLETKEEKLIVEWNFNPEDWLSLRFNVSLDNNLLIQTETLKGETIVSKVNSWHPFEREIVFETDFSPSIWPVFSPDGNYFATQEHEVKKDGSTFIVIFDMKNFGRKAAFDIGDYELDYIWISDWVI